MKQKIYGLIIILIAILIFVSFSIICSEDKNTGDFEVIIVSSTEVTETVTYTTVTSAPEITSVHTKKSETVRTTSVKISETVTETETTTQTVNFPIDINTAGIDELKALDGIGDAIASAIIEYRETYGNFRNREELLNVSGIGEKKLSDIYDFIFVENETYDIPDDTSEVFEEYEEEQPEESEEPAETEIISDTPEETSENIIVNLNTAEKDDLMKLPYVDEQIADDILKLRETIEYFSHPYELLMVESLTQEQVAEIIKFVTIE